VLRLSPRETEVLRLVAAGMNNKQIAQELGIAHGTVKKHVGNIRSKTETWGGRVKLTTRGLIWGVVRPDDLERGENGRNRR